MTPEGKRFIKYQIIGTVVGLILALLLQRWLFKDIRDIFQCLTVSSATSFSCWLERKVKNS